MDSSDFDQSCSVVTYTASNVRTQVPAHKLLLLLLLLLHLVGGSKSMYTKHTLVYKYENTKIKYSANA